FHVTGVQTCALPILKSGVEVGPSFKDEFAYELCYSENCNTAKVTIVVNDSVGCVFMARPDSVNADTIQTSLIRIAVLKNDVVCRSEERRVGEVSGLW